MSIQSLWYKHTLRSWLLWPLAVLFGLITGCRRWLYRKGIKSSSRAEAFVIVVGNITAGGNGKTPVVLALVEYLRARGIKVGVLSRGYGGTARAFPHLISPQDPATLVGDEPRLIASRTGVPVVIDPQRARGAAYLANHCDCEVIICDDGLQHYALHRDMEIVVMDGRGVGNGHLMPMGPLREKPWRLQTVDMIIANGEVNSQLLTSKTPCFSMTLKGTRFVNVKDLQRERTAADFTDSAITAMAGIGHPQRFFSQLTTLNITPQSTIPFADHYQFTPQDIPAGTVLMTEKDAVKVGSFAHEDCWFLPVDAMLPDTFYQQLDNRLIKSGIGLERKQNEL